MSPRCFLRATRQTTNRAAAGDTDSAWRYLRWVAAQRTDQDERAQQLACFGQHHFEVEARIAQRPGLQRPAALAHGHADVGSLQRRRIVDAVASHADHRMAHAGVILGLAVDDVLVEDIARWPAILRQSRQLLRGRFGIDHVTLQPEWLNGKRAARIAIRPRAAASERTTARP